MPCVTETVVVRSTTGLPQDAQALFPVAVPGTSLAGPGVWRLNACLDWYRLIEAHACPPDARPEYLILRHNGVAVAVMPLLRGTGDAVQAFTTPYTCQWQPLLRDERACDIAQSLGLAFAAASGAVARLDAIDADAAWLGPFCAGLRGAGRVILRFEHFGNWQADIGDGWAGYLATRPGALRETIRRRSARLQRDPAFRLEMIHGADRLEAGIAGFEAVYARSWKQSEPYPDFNPAMMRFAAARGVLRLALLWQGDQVMAAQYWVVADGTAQVLKLAHDSAADALSPGTVLTAWAIRNLIESDRIRVIDFGRGDDPYKKQWSNRRHQRIGLVAVNPWTFSGILVLARHFAGHVKRRMGKALPRT